MSKLFNEHEFADPWLWCLGVIKRHELDAKRIANETGTPYSTLRALLSGSNNAPRYVLLTQVIALCISYETTGGPPVKEDEPVEEEDFDFI